MKEPWDFWPNTGAESLPSGGCLCGYSYRIFPFHSGRQVLWRRICRRLRFRQNLILGTITLLTCLLWNIFAKGYLKQLSVLAGLIVGYVIAIFLGKVDLSLIMSGGIISFPHLLPFMPEFHAGAIISACIIFLVSAAETIGDTSALVSGGLNREITGKEISGSLACDGYASALSTVFGCPPVTSFSQNVGLVAMTKVVNRFTIMTGAACMILAGLLPPVGNFLPPCLRPCLADAPS